ncbi:uncharacterized protein DSM5745_09144 [Aspergillus mulundensis]|uniref:Uncharacterized protein n=1 Tax=Aspergillus mulundensis TaxID=1810919 RepID=A0A3D8R009_9EURO|nr:hypothetical protein DSM5745_09144 [Aspergillus mulundensis]RDW67278.1 hypothetical protein DSM5745_09144 [Aspergillus mulundensis]
MSFLFLPPELRLQIYTYLLDPNTYVTGYTNITRLTSTAYEDAHADALASNESDRPQIPSVSLARIYITRRTPSILLLNRQITAEALPVLYSVPLTLTGTPSTYLSMRQMDIAEFISETLLQRIKVVALRLTQPEKAFVLGLLDIWGKGCALTRLVVEVPRDEDRGVGDGVGPGWLSLEARRGRHWGVVESRIRTFAEVLRIPLEMRTIETSSDGPE